MQSYRYLLANSLLKPRIIIYSVDFCVYSWINNTVCGANNLKACLPPDPKLSSIFCHSLAYLMDPGRHAIWLRCSQAMHNLLILAFFDFSSVHWPWPRNRHAAKKGTNWCGRTGVQQFFFCEQATLNLKSFNQCQKHSHIKKFWKKCAWGTFQFCPTTGTVLRRAACRKATMFS